MFLRIGYFFLPIGLLLLFVFGASYQVDSPDYSLFLAGIVSIIIGVVIIVKNRPAPTDAGRFRLFRRKSKDDNGNGDVS
jgi:hypothetical protein